MRIVFRKQPNKRLTSIVRRSAVCAALFCAAASFTAHAAPPFAEQKLPLGMTQERYDAVSDNVLLWEELGDRIKLYNPTYARIRKDAEESIGDMKFAIKEDVDSLRSGMDTVDETIESLKQQQTQLMQLPSAYVPMGGILVPKEMALQQLQSALTATQAARRELKGAMGQMGSVSRQISTSDKNLEKQLKPLSDNLLMVIEGLVISYEQLEVNKSMVEQQVALYQSLLSMQQQLQANGMATAVEVQSYENQLRSAENTLRTVENGKYQLKAAIAQQLGYPTDGSFSFGELPVPSAEYLAGRNAENDRERAVVGNQTVASVRKQTVSNKGALTYELRDKSENAALGNASAKFDALRADVESKALAMTAAATTAERARLTKESAERKFALGMAGRAEFEGAKMEYISYEATEKLAKLSYLQAVRNYEWAVQGMMNLE